jgi:hypothetical protein
MWQGVAVNLINYIEFGLRHLGAYPRRYFSESIFFLVKDVCYINHNRYCLFVEFNEVDPNPLMGKCMGI